MNSMNLTFTPTPGVERLARIVAQARAIVEVDEAYPRILQALHVKGREVELGDFLDAFGRANSAIEQASVLKEWEKA